VRGHRELRSRIRGGLSVWWVCICSSWALLFLARVAPAADAPPLAKNPDGSFTATTSNYTAQVGADGNLHSLNSGGTEFLLDGYRGLVGGGYMTFERGQYWPVTVFRFPKVVQTAPDRLTATGKDHRLTYRFLPDAIELGFTHTAQPCFWYFAIAPAIKDIVEHDSGDAITTKNIGFEREGQPHLFAASGANVLLPRASLRATRDAGKATNSGPFVEFIWMPPTAANQTLTKRLVIHRQPTAADAMRATLLVPRANHILPGGAPAELGLAAGLRFPGLTVDGQVELVLREFKQKKVVFQQRQPFKLAAMGKTRAMFSVPLAAGFYDGVLTARQGKEVLATRTFPLAYDIQHMTPPERPADFDTFWDDTLAEQEKIPVNLQMALDREHPAYKLYKIRFDGLLGRRFHAWLSLPTAPGKHGAHLTLPPSGVNMTYMPPCGNIVGMSLAVAGQEVGITQEQLKSWDYFRCGIEKRETWYYRAILAACSRAVDILAARPETDLSRICVHGGSQGGGLSFITAALNPKVTLAVGSSPGLFGLEWKLRYPNSFNWPPIQFNKPPDPKALEERIAVVRYCDAANFAPRIRCAVLLNVGLQDHVTMPVGVLSAWQRLGNARIRALLADPWGGHNGPRGAGTLWAQWSGKHSAGKLDDVAQFTRAESLPVLVETRRAKPSKKNAP